MGLPATFRIMLHLLGIDQLYHFGSIQANIILI